jgi:predicted secreted protein
MKITKPLRTLKNYLCRPSDKRGKRMVFLIECILNQNSRDIGAASFKAMNFEVINLCMKYHVGMVQIPCPEMICLGFGRKRKPGQSILDVLDTDSGRRCCADLAGIVGGRVKEYIDSGNKVVAVLGGNPESPGCAVHYNGATRRKLSGQSGIFMQALFQELSRIQIDVPFLGIRDCRSDWFVSDLQSLELIFRNR